MIIKLFILLWTLSLGVAYSIQHAPFRLHHKLSAFTQQNQHFHREIIALKAATIILEDKAERSVHPALQQLKNEVTPLVSSIALGTATAALVIATKKAFGWIDTRVRIRWPIVTPLVGSLLVGILYSIDRGIGQPAAPLPVQKDSKQTPSKIALQTLLVRLLGMIIALGTGNAVGFAGPAAEIGMVSAYLLSSLLCIDGNNGPERGLLLAGAAAGLTANFNAPLTGTLYALQVTMSTLPPSFLLGLSPKDVSKDGFMLAVSVLSSGGMFCRALPPILPCSTWLALGGLGIVAATHCVGLSFELYASLREFWKKLLKPIDIRIRPVMSGIVNAAAAAQGFPQTLGQGFSTINTLLGASCQELKNSYRFLLGKAICLPLTIASGMPGGQFAPLLFLGGGLGAVFASFLQLSNPSIFVVGGAAAMLAANFRAALMTSVLVMELTRRPELGCAMLLCTASACFASNICSCVKEWRTRK
eukprot:scaffold4041_cov189-Ochromonas_danica.AAC.13